MKQLISQRNIYIIVVLLVGSGLFYWYEWRPSSIRTNCFTAAQKSARSLLKTKAELNATYKSMADKDMWLKDDFNQYYLTCLNSKGIEK